MGNIYETISIVQPIKQLIEQCPFTAPFSVNLIPIGYEKYTRTQEYEQGMLDNGIADILEVRYNNFCEKEIVFKRVISFFFLQNKNPTDTDSSMIDWRTNFIEWVAWLDDNGGTPKFSYIRYADGSTKQYESLDERLWAQNAQIVSTEEDGMTTYMVDIHLLYTVKYKKIRRD